MLYRVFISKEYLTTKRKDDYNISSTLSFSPNLEHEYLSGGTAGFVSQEPRETNKVVMHYGISTKSFVT